MRRYGRLEIEDALRALDSVCTGPRSLVLVGGAAVALHTHTTSGTQDIDHFPPDLHDLVARCAAADLVLPPLSAPGVLEYPWNAEDRLERALPELQQLQVWLLEPHDLTLSKVVRWHDGDEEDVRELHHARRLSRSILLERFVDEMTHVTGNARRIGGNFVQCIDVLFGEIAADEAREALVGWPRRR